MVNNWEKKHMEKKVEKGPSYSKTYFFLHFLGRVERQNLPSPPQRAQNYNEKNGAKKPSHGEKEAKRQQKGVHANSGFCLRGTIAYYCPPPPLRAIIFLIF